jgi:hypothetical protein
MMTKDLIVCRVVHIKVEEEQREVVHSEARLEVCSTLDTMFPTMDILKRTQNVSVLLLSEK